MGRKKPTLRDFGGGIPLSMMDSDDEREVRSREKFRKIKRGLGVPLERDLIERLDPQLLETGQDRHWFHLQPREADWADAMYIRAEPTDEEWKFDPVVQNPDTDPLVEMPSALLRNEVVRGIDNPFHKADPDDYVVVRYLPGDAIEIHLEEMYKAHPHFVWIRAAAPVVMVSSEQSEDEELPRFNPAAYTPFDSQMFEVVLFDWEVFFTYFQEIIGRDLAESEEAPPTLDEFTRVLAKGGVKSCSTPFVRIYWNSDSPFSERTLCLEEEDLKRFRVVLPAYGMHDISCSSSYPWMKQLLLHRSSAHLITDSAVEDSGFYVSDKNGSTHVNRKYIDRINERWWGRFFEVPEHGPPILYLPASPEPAFLTESFGFD